MYSASRPAILQTQQTSGCLVYKHSVHLSLHGLQQFFRAFSTVEIMYFGISLLVFLFTNDSTQGIATISPGKRFIPYHNIPQNSRFLGHIRVY